MKVAVVGGGTIGSVHADSYIKSGANLIAVVEPDENNAKAFEEKYGAKVYPSLDGLLASEDLPDIVSICTPPATHRELAIEALAAGVNVLCEKPMASSLADALAIKEAALSSAALFGMAYCHRFQPEVEFMRASILEGKVGRVRTFRNEFSGHQDDIEKRWFGKKALAGGGVLLDAGIHSLDLFRYLCGDIREATACWSDSLDGTALEVEHTVAVSLLSTGGVVGTIACSWKSPTGGAVISVAGSGGSLTYDYFQPGIVTFVDERGNTEAIRVPDTGPRFDRQIAAFMKSVGTGTPHRTTADDGVAGMQTVEALYSHQRLTVGTSR